MSEEGTCLLVLRESKLDKSINIISFTTQLLEMIENTFNWSSGGNTIGSW